MSKLRSKFITVLAVLFCTLLLLSTALFIPKNENAAEAFSSTQESTVSEIYDNDAQRFNYAKLQNLFNAILGGSNKTFTDVKNVATTDGNNTITSKNVIVEFGGMKWLAVYLSKAKHNLGGVSPDKSVAGYADDGDVVLTLWRAHTTKNSRWNIGYSSKDTGIKYPSSLYSTSYMRAVTLNNGGDYWKSENSLYTSSDNGYLGRQNSSNDFAPYTMKNPANGVSVVDYVVAPRYIKWQHEQHATISAGFNSDLSNDAWGTIIPENINSQNVWYQDQYSGYYSNWKDDLVWLPSLTEVGVFNGSGGLWNTTQTQRQNPTDTNAWLRSAGQGTIQNCYRISTDGNGQAPTTVDTENLVRAAIHLNLTKAMTLVAEDIETTYTGSELGIPTIYSINKNSVPWYIPTVYPSEVEYAYKLDGLVTPVLNAGTYKAAMTFNSNSIGFTWESPDTPNGGTKTINIEVKEKPVSVVFNKGTSTDPFTAGSKVTSGVENQYPTVTYDSGQIAADDDENGDRYSTHYPKLQIRYKNADSSTKSYDSTVKPTLPGKYIAIAEIDTEDAAENKKIINYKIITEGGADRISFEVTPIEVKNPTYSGSLTYSGTEQTVNLENKDGLAHGLIKYTVTKKNGDVVTEKGGKELKDITDDSFKVLDSGEYTVTFAFVDKDVKDTHAWKDSGKNDDYKLTVNVAKKTLDFTFNSSSTDFTNNSWKAKTAMPFTVKIVGECGQEKVELVVSHTDKEGVTETPLDDQGDRNYTIPALDTSTKYKLYCKLSDADVNKNYEIKYNGNVVERIEKAFVVTAAQVSFNASNLVWVYVNSAVADGDEQSIVSGDEVAYNGEEFTIALKSNELTQYGLMVDTDFAPPTGFDGELTGTYVGTYTVKVRIKAVSADYNFPAQVFTFEWKIKKATYDLSTVTKLEWSYRARGSEMGEYPSDGIQFEGGQRVGEDGLIEIYVSGGLPDGLSVESVENKGIEYSSAYEIGSYTAEIKKLKNSNSDNYEDVTNLSGYDWAKFDWQIIKRTLLTDSWTDAKYSDKKVTAGPELETYPYSPKLRYEYYDNKECSGDALKLEDLSYDEGKTKTYWARVFINETDSYSFDNFLIDPEKNTYEFTVGEVKTAVEIEVQAGGTYDGTAKGATVTIVGNVPGIDTSAFEITYYRANSNVALDGAPTDAGSYRAVIALKAGYTKFYIDSPKSYDFTIDTLKLTVPPTEMENLTYDGTERDVAKLVGLPDGWENYISINIKSLTNGIAHPAGSTIKVVADYEVSFSIKDGVNTGTPNNVQWSDDTKTPKKLKISIVKLVLHAEGWAEADYDSYIVFTENNGRNFVVYTVTDVEGKAVDKATVEKSKNESFIVTVAVAEEHNGNVEIMFGDGVSPKYEFFTNAGLPPVKVALPTIADLTFNGENQTFVVDFGEFEEYIELDLSLGDVSALTQFNAGEYKVYFKIKSGVNAVWADTGDRKSVAVTFKMKVLVLDEPQVKSGERFTYSGSAQSATLNIDAAILARFMKIEGDYTATNAGDYTFTLSIDPSFAGNVVWASAAQGVDTVKTVDWTIEKARVSVKWTQSGDVPELDIPEEFKDLDVEYEIRDENGNLVTPDQMEAGKTYTVTAKLKEGSAANYEFVDDSGKSLSTATDGFGFEFKSGKSPFPWWIIALIAGLLVATIAVIIIVVKKRQTADGEDFDDYYGDDYDYDDEEIEEDDYDDEDF